MSLYGPQRVTESPLALAEPRVSEIGLVRQLLSESILGVNLFYTWQYDMRGGRSGSGMKEKLHLLTQAHGGIGRFGAD